MDDRHLARLRPESLRQGEGVCYGTRGEGVEVCFDGQDPSTYYLRSTEVSMHRLPVQDISPSPAPFAPQGENLI